MRAIERASILVISLWALCLLTTFAVYLGYGVRQKIILVERLSRRDDLHHIAVAGMNRAILELDKDDLSGTDSFRDSWSNNTAVFKDVSVGNAKFNVSYDYLDSLRECAKRTLYGVEDEQRKINVNTADLGTLALLFQNLCLDAVEAQNLAACIIDWRDKDGMLTVPGSAESSFYLGLSEPHQAKDAPFECLEELMLVKGITEELFDKMKDYVTIYGDGTININTASSTVLFCLGLSGPVVEKIIAFRYGKDEALSTQDDGVFSGPESVAAQLSQWTPMPESEVTELSALAASGSIVTASNIFMIKSVASLGSGTGPGPRQAIRATVKRSGEILSYVEF